MSEVKTNLAANLTALLQLRGGISRLDLSREIGIADGTLGRIKYGTGNPTVDVLERLAAAFGIEPWILLADPSILEMTLKNEKGVTEMKARPS